VKTTITAKDETELYFRIGDLEKRGWSLLQIIAPKEKFSIGYVHRNTHCKYRSKRVYESHNGYAPIRAVMERKEDT